MKLKFILYPILFLLFFAAIAVLFLMLWNWLMPAIFEIREINFWESAGLLAMAKILFCGFLPFQKKCNCNSGHHSSMKEKFKSKWQDMSDEDKKKWEEKFGKCNAGKSFWGEHKSESNC